MRADDALKYAAALVRERLDWTTDEIGGSMCDQSHDAQLDSICDLNGTLGSLASEFGDPATYSDGRPVRTSAWIVRDELATSHVWHPDPTREPAESWRGHLPSGDPDVPSPGIYEVTTIPAAQDIHVRVVRTA